MDIQGVTNEDIKPAENANPVKTLRMRYDAWMKRHARISPRAWRGACPRSLS